MAVDDLTEPLLPLPRGRDDSATPPAHSIVNVAAASTATAAATAKAKYPAFAFAVYRDAAFENASAANSSSTAAFASATSPTNLPPVAVHREREDAAALQNASAPTTPALTSASPQTTNWQGRGADANAAPDVVHRDAALRSPPASPSARLSPGRRANLLASLGPARGSTISPSPTWTHVPPTTRPSVSASGADAPPRPASPSPANVFVYTSLSDALRHTASPVAAAMSESESPIEDASSSPLRGRNSPVILGSTDVNTERVGGDSGDGSTLNRQVERIRKRHRSSLRAPRGRRLYRGLGLRRRLAPVPQKDTWDKESFMYTCVLVLLVGLVAYLSTVLDGWSPYVRVIFIGIFGAAIGLACIGAMALISETPDPSARHFSHIVSRLSFIVGSLEFELAVFYLLGEAGFIAWLVVAAFTVIGMTYIWKVGSPASFGALVSCTRYVYSKMIGFFRRA